MPSLSNKFDYDLVTEVFKNLPKSTILAGGAVRDTLLNKPIRDYDFFVGHYVNEAISAEHQDEQYAWLHKHFKIVSQLGEYPQQAFTVYEGMGRFAGVQLMILNYETLDTYNSPAEFFRRTVDIGLCSCWLDSTGAVITTPEFTKDRERKTLTVRLPPEDKITLYSIGVSLGRHLPRLMEKYPDYTVKLDVDSAREYYLDIQAKK